MPYKYQQIVSGMWSRPDSDAYTIGRVFHVMVLEGMDEYYKRYISQGPINPSTGKPYGTATNKWAEFAERAKIDGMEVITPVQHNVAYRMMTSVENHVRADMLLGQSPIREGVIRCEYNGFNCQIRMDAFGETSGIGDLKSCASLSKFPYDARNFGYFNQLAFYRQVLRIACPDVCHDVHIIATEKGDLNTTGLWKLNVNDLDFAREENEGAMAKLAWSMQTGNWPTGYEEILELTC